MKSKKHKIVIIVLLLLCGLIILGSFYTLFKAPVVECDKIYAGIGGAVNDSGVYEVYDETLLYELIRNAEGLHERADFSRIDPDMKVIPFEVYCIPYLAEKKREMVKTKPPIAIPNPDPKLISLGTTSKINIVYAGLPRTYLYISIYPDNDLITVTHIPWYTRATSRYEYPRTLYEIYLTGGVAFLLRSTKNLLKDRIDFFFTQKRPSWIKFIDYLGGIEVDLPNEFADEYNLPRGNYNISGPLAWEYISYISKNKRKNQNWVTGSGYRIKYQKDFMLSMYRKFKQQNFIMQGDILNNILADAETNMKPEDFLKIANMARKMNNFKLEFYTIPGIIEEYDSQLFWVTDLQEYQFKQSKIISDQIKEIDQLRIDKGGFGGKANSVK